MRNRALWTAFLSVAVVFFGIARSADSHLGQLAQTPVTKQPFPQNAIVVDDSTPGKFSTSINGWRKAPFPVGFNNSVWIYQTNTKSKSDAFATWDIGSVSGGTYDVYATWLWGSNYATDLSFVINGQPGSGYNGSANTLLKTTINQRKAPLGINWTGSPYPWQRLGRIQIGNGDTTVKATISGKYNRNMNADAVLLLPIGGASSSMRSSAASSILSGTGCITEGQSVAVVPDAPLCCTGLTKISRSLRVGNQCVSALGSQVCTQCGNGQCGLGENPCNCPADCEDIVSSQASSQASSTAIPACGDGITQSMEQCDDSNGINGDGCNVNCMIEPGWTCWQQNGASVCGRASSSSVSSATISSNPSCWYEQGGPWVSIDLYNRTATDSIGNFISNRTITPGQRVRVDYAYKIFERVTVSPVVDQVDLDDNTHQGFLKIAPMTTTTYRLTPTSRPECAVDFTVIVAGASSVSSAQSSSRMSSSRTSSSAGTGSNLAALAITQKSIGTVDTAVKNQKNIPLLRYEAFAEQADVLLTQTVFTATGRTIANANNYTLWVDTNNDLTVDTILQSNVLPQADTVTFANFAGAGYVIPKERSVTFEVHADVASQFVTPPSLQLLFKTNNPEYIKAETVSTGAPLGRIMTNGFCAQAPCNIGVWTTSSKIWNFVSSGDLFVTKDATPIRSRQLLAGTLGDSILRLQLRANAEPIDVTKFWFAVDGEVNSIERLELFLDAATQPFAVATQGASCYVGSNEFCSNLNTQQLIVQKGTTAMVTVRPRLKSDENGAVSGEKIRIGFGPNSAHVQARGAISSNVLSGNDGDAVAEGEVFIGTMISGPNAEINAADSVVVFSKITSIVNASPDPDGSMIRMGTTPIGQFKFTAASNNNTLNGLNKAHIQVVIFTINSSNVAFDKTSFRMYAKDNPTAKSACSVPVDTGSSPYHVFCSISPTMVDSTIGPDENRTFVLEANITNSSIIATGISTLQVSLERFSDPSLTGIVIGLSHIGWHDSDGPLLSWIEYGESIIRSTLYRD